jgi:hypothetical protein
LSGRTAAIAGPNSARSPSISKPWTFHGKLADFGCIISNRLFSPFFSLIYINSEKMLKKRLFFSIMSILWFSALYGTTIAARGA